MKRILFYFSLVFLIFQVDLKLTDEERQKFLDKLTKKINLDNVDELKITENKFQSSYLRESNAISYDPEKIKEIMNFYDFPEEYNYLNDKKITPIIKDQQKCGCCWSHAATSALAYRYKLLDIDVDLSPQDAVSCFIKECTGIDLISPELNLIKNGTVTEGCLPFSSGDGIVKDICPTSCKDGSQFKKYYSQNAYSTEDYYSQETFYDIVILIMDQLTTKGPVVTGIDVYYDFVLLNYDPQKCHDEVYTYDGRSEYYGGHAVVIVGYGFLNGKYYWLIQNSWGEEACDHGFAKIEFAQIGVERVAFSEPYIKEEVIDPKEVTVSFDSINDECIMKLKTTSTLEDWENTLEINFTDSVTQKNFNYECGTTSFPKKGKMLSCYYEYWNSLEKKGVFEFKASQSLGSENIFKLDDSFKGLNITFWGYDYLGPIMLVKSQIFYVSEEGSKIIFYYLNATEDDSTIPPIYGPKSEKALSDCHKIILEDEQEIKVIYCNIKKDELNYFYDKESNYTPVVYDILCGYKYPTDNIVFKLNKIYYPVYRFKKIYIPETNKITDPEIDNFTAVIDIEGNPKGSTKNNMFIVLTYIEKDNKNKTYLTLCPVIDYQKPIRDTNITCIINKDTEKEILYDNIYFLPYTIPYNPTFPYEAIIEKTIKGIIPIIPPPPLPPEPSSSQYFKISYIIMGLLLLL